MKYIQIIAACLILYLKCGSYAADLTEKDAVFMALEKNSDLEISRTSFLRDSLNLLKKLNDTSIKTTLSSSASFSYDLKNSETDNSENLKLEIGKDIPSGGGINISVEQNIDDPFTTDASVSFSQPLLKGAWKNSEVNYGLAVQRKNYAEAGLKFKLAILSNMSSIRRSYWSHFEKLSLLKISMEELKYSQGLLNSEIKRFEIGETSELDTLSAALETIRAQQKILSLKNDIKISGNDLSLKLMVEENVVSDLSGNSLEVTQLPSKEDFIDLVLEHDPQRDIFLLIKERLELNYSNKKNKFLPQLDLSLTYNYDMSGDKITSENNIKNNAVVNLIFSYSLPNTIKKIERQEVELSIKDNEIRIIKHERELKNQVDELYYAWNLEREQLKLSQTSRNIAEKQLKAAEKNLELGAVDMYTKLKAKNDYINAELQYLKRQISLKRLEIIFDEITGNLLPKFGVEIK